MDFKLLHSPWYVFTEEHWKILSKMNKTSNSTTESFIFAFSFPVNPYEFTIDKL